MLFCGEVLYESLNRTGVGKKEFEVERELGRLKVRS